MKDFVKTFTRFQPRADFPAHPIFIVPVFVACHASLAIQSHRCALPYLYTSIGGKTSDTNQLGHTRDFEYDDQGGLVKVILPDLDPNPLRNDVFEDYVYDSRNRLDVLTHYQTDGIAAFAEFSRRTQRAIARVR